VCNQQCKLHFNTISTIIFTLNLAVADPSHIQASKLMFRRKNMTKISSSSNTDGRFLSPLRYPGSKRRLAQYISHTLDINKLSPALYIEPFVGGGSVGLDLLLKEKVGQFIFMDLDPFISHFWDAVFFDTDWLIKEISTIDVSIEKFQEIKNATPRDKREYAINALFLNRTSFSGILRDEVGPLGGKTQNSTYKIDCRFPREKIIKRIENIALHRDRVFGVWTCDWKEGIQRIRKYQGDNKLPTEKLFFYLDPPFINKADKLYRHFFEMDDHIALHDFLMELDDAWILSYDCAEEVELLYGNNGSTKEIVDMNYSTATEQSRKSAQEIVISNLQKLPTQEKMN